jgi:hypothetical protein
VLLALVLDVPLAPILDVLLAQILNVARVRSPTREQSVDNEDAGMVMEYQQPTHSCLTRPTIVFLCGQRSIFMGKLRKLWFPARLWDS